MLFKDISIINQDIEYIKHQDVYIQGDRIISITDTGTSIDIPSDCEIYDGLNKLLMPGFVNAHTHSPMVLMRGYGEGLPLQDWLNTKILPFEDFLYSKAVYYATLLAEAEAMRFGIVSQSDMYFWIDDMVRAIASSGMKVNIARSLANPRDLPLDELPGFKEMRDSILMYDGFMDGRIIVDVSVHAEYSTSEATIRAAAEMAKEYDTHIQMHISETLGEVEKSKQRHGGLSPVRFMESCGMFDQPALVAHAVWLDDDDISILSNHGVSVAVNPISNLKLSSGICDSARLLDAGINVAVGTDGSASNNNFNFIEELKMFSLLAKLKSSDPAQMTAKQAIYAGTRAGAIAQGRMDCGLIKPGFKADLIVIDEDRPYMVPCHDPLSNLIYSACGTDVCLTMCDGRILYQDGDFKTIDIDETKAKLIESTNKILERL